MACTNQTQNVSVGPVYVYWQQQETTCVQTVADSSSSLNNDYITFSSPTGLFYAWFNVGGAGTDPAPGGTGIAVAISANATAAAVATALAAAIDANANFHSKVSADQTDHVIIQNVAAGAATNATAGTSPFTVTVLREGANLDLGLLQGDVEIGFTTDVVDIVAHQTGSQILEQKITGINLDGISLTLLETNAARIQELIQAVGETVTPGGGTAVYGVGTEAVGLSKESRARKLVLHPVANAAAVLTDDYAFWRAHPNIDSLVFSSENPNTATVTFSVYKDSLINDDVDVWVRGDHSQNLLK